MVNNMNIFALDRDPQNAAEMMCDKHIPKMIVESAQMLACAAIRHGATPDMMPLTKKGTPYKGGYYRHPCTVWAGDAKGNYEWLVYHGLALCDEYEFRFNNGEHTCKEAILILADHIDMIPLTYPPRTPFYQAMPEEYQQEDSIKAYRAYYHSKDFAEWKKGRDAPSWWNSGDYLYGVAYEVDYSWL